MEFYGGYHSRGHTVSFVLLGILVALASVFSGCQSFRVGSDQQAEEKDKKSSTYSQETLRRLFESAYESLGNRDSLKQAYRYLQQIDPNVFGRQWYYGTLSEMCFYLATYSGVAEDSSKTLYEQGREAALRVLETRPDVQRFLSAEGEISAETVNDTIPYIPVNALYWWAINSILWTEDEPPLERVVARRKLDRAISLIANAEPDFRYGAVQRLRGLLLTISPDGDLNQAKRAFEQAVTENGVFWTNHFMYGRYYGITLRKRMIFRQQMEEIIEATNTYPLEFAELNQLVKVRAQEYFQSEDAFFSASIKFGLSRPNK